MGKVKAYMMDIQEAIEAALDQGLWSEEEVYEYVHKQVPLASRRDCDYELHLMKEMWAEQNG
jgi:hypothetical protein